MIIALLTIGFLNFSFLCNSSFDVKTVDFFYNNYKEDAIKNFNNKNIYRRENKIILEILANDTAKYIFTYDNYQKTDPTKLKVEINFPKNINDGETDSIIQLLGEPDNDEKNIESLMLKYGNFIINKMDQYKLHEVSHSFSNIGLDIVFYFTWEDRLVYISDITEVQNPTWINVLQKAKKYDENWYYYKIDE